jgi:hypothetical protein
MNQKRMEDQIKEKTDESYKTIVFFTILTLPLLGVGGLIANEYANRGIVHLIIV